MADRIHQRLLRDESGFTLVELLIVAMILVILTAVAVPAYFQFRDNAYKTTAMSNAKAATAAAAAYGESNSTYAGMTIARLKTYDAGLATGTYVNNSGAEAAGVTQRAPLNASHFCVYATSGRWFAYQLNPSGALTITTLASAVCS